MTSAPVAVPPGPPSWRSAVTLVATVVLSVAPAIWPSGWSPGCNRMVQRNYFNGVKTAFLLGALSAIILLIGAWFGGGPASSGRSSSRSAINGYSYWNSGKLALRAMHARPVTRGRAAGHVPDRAETWRPARTSRCPRCTSRRPWRPNAFATGRNPQNAAVCCTEGILQLLDERELRGVLAHELAHVYNRDILIASVAATLASVIVFVAQLRVADPDGWQAAATAATRSASCCS